MSDFWHWWIIVLTVASILGCVWLIRWAGRTDQTQSAAGEPVGHTWDDDIYEMNHPMPRWWLWLFYATIIFSFLYLILYPGLGRNPGLLGWTQHGQHATQMAELDAMRDRHLARFDGMGLAELMADPDAMRTGARVYAHNCALCHGSDARGAFGFPNLTDGHWQWGGDPDTILATILDGRTGMMPALGSVTGDDAYGVAAYVYQLSGRDLPAHVGSVTRARGEQQYQQFCSACHGPTGQGNPALGAPDFTRNAFTYGGSLDAIRATVNEGRSGVMPAHRELLGEARVRLVTAYLLHLNHRSDD